MTRFPRPALCLAVLTSLPIVAAGGAVADSGIYASAHAGLTFPPDITADGVSGLGQAFSIDQELDNGFNIGGAVGYRFDLPAFDFRLEGEVTYREQDVSNILVDGVPAQNVGGDTSSLSFLANALIDIEILPFLNPYFGAGIGIAGVESDGELSLPQPIDGIINSRFDGGTETELVYQFIVGNTLPINDTLEAFIDARYFRAADPDFALESALDSSIFGPTEADFEIFSLNVGLRFNF